MATNVVVVGTFEHGEDWDGEFWALKWPHPTWAGWYAFQIFSPDREGSGVIMVPALVGVTDEDVTRRIVTDVLRSRPPLPFPIPTYRLETDMANIFQFGNQTNITPFTVHMTVQAEIGGRPTLDLHLIPPSFGGAVRVDPELAGRQVKDQIIRFDAWEVDDLRRVLRAIPTRWISMKIEHPAEDGWYLVFDTIRAGPQTLLSRFEDGEWVGPLLKPSHWQPLPAPPDAPTNR